MVWLGLVIGALWGAYMAKKRGGRKMDMLQYAAGFGIAFALVALIANIIILRMM
jgi:hypothetical protein